MINTNVSDKISGVHWSPLEAIGGEVCDWRKGINTNVSNKISGVHWSPLEAIGGGDQKCIILLAVY